MPRIKTLPALLALLTVGLTGFGIWSAARHAPRQADADGTASRPPATTPAGAVKVDDTIFQAFEFFGGKPAAADSLQTLTALRASLLALPKDEAVGRIRSFLAAGKDHPTGLSFGIAKDGMLSEWPSFRTFLLDALLAVDPAVAAETGRTILEKPTTADEWALALRNVARGDASADPDFLRAKTEELIRNPAWQADPSIGYLNAFDVLVHVKATASTPLLSGLIQMKDRKDLAHAGFLTLDRLVQSQPVEVLTRLSADTALQQGRPEMVAQQFARADLRDPAQQALVKAWLIDPARSAAELRSFAGVYPNNNQFVSNNLLTAQAAAPGDDLAAHDREALKVITAWVSDPAFSSVQDHLRTMVSRLDGFVGSRDRSTLSSPPPE
jgi:hypothetical protein